MSATPRYDQFQAVINHWRRKDAEAAIGRRYPAARTVESVNSNAPARMIRVFMRGPFADGFLVSP